MLEQSTSSRVVELLWRMLRYAYASWFLFFSLFMLFGFGGHIPGSNGLQADPFLKALRDIGFIEPLLMVCYVFGGLSLLFDRTAPVGIVVLAAPVIVIFCFHLFHTGLIVWGSLWLIGLAALAWRFGARLASLWNNSV